MSLPPPVPSPGAERVHCAFSGVEGAAAEMVQIGGAWVTPEHKDAAVQWLQQGGEFHQREQPRPLPGLLATVRSTNGLVLRNWRALLLVELTTGLPWWFWQTWMENHLPFEEYSVSDWSYYFTDLWVVAILWGIFVHSLMVCWNGGKVVLKDAVVAGIRRSWVVFLILLPMAPASSLLFDIRWDGTYDHPRLEMAEVFVNLTLFSWFLPFFVLTVFLSFAGYLTVDRRLGLVQSVQESFKLVKNGFWRLAGYTALDFGWMLGAYYVIVEVIAALPYEVSQHWELTTLMYWVINSPRVWLMIFFLVLYKGLVGEQETIRRRPA